MVDIIKLPEHVETVISSVTCEDLERLVKGIDHKQITDYVKHNKHLQQHVFPGFRPTNLPWDRVPTKLARDAQNQLPAIRNLIRIWLIANSAFCERARHEVDIENIEDDAAKLLATLDHNGGDRLLWALLLDEREEIQAALTNGLRQAIITDTSTFFERANRYRLTVELEKATQDIKNLKDKLGKSTERDRLLNRKVEQCDELQNKLEALKERQKNDELGYREELRRLKAALQQAVEERNVARQKIDELQLTIQQEQLHTRELLKRIDGLEASLNVAITGQDESASNVQRRLNDTLQLLEEQRKENTLLQQKLNKAEKEKVIAYDKRDEEFGRRQQAEVHIEKLVKDKNVLIQQRREDNNQQEKLKRELHQTQQALTEKSVEEQKAHLALSQLDESWDLIIEALSRHLILSLSEQQQIFRPIDSHEKWVNWQQWQQLESNWVRPLFALHRSISVEDLASAERAQKLLALRWYLLEYLKLGLTETFNANNRVLKGVEQ